MEMKRRILALAVALILVLLALGAGNRTFIRFMQYSGGEDYYCEGYFMETGSGIVHEWRNNPECSIYGDTSLHIVFKPTDKFEDEGCDDENCLGCYPGPWSLNETYVDLGDDEAELADFLAGEFWACVYLWE
jgi:hypothetical protein